jgi:heat-inducible transcriptional repressor
MHADKPALMSCSAGAIIGVDWRIAAFSEADIVSINTPIGSPQVGLAQLDERSREIFRQIVESYLATGEPVGSRNISRLIPITLSPASVRNVMADLEALGLIYAPHTSAGRLPTELGLRFFVDALLEIGDLSGGDRQSIEAQVKAARGGSLDAVLAEASQLLSGLSRGAGVVTAAKNNPRLKQIEFVRLEPGRALVVLVSEDGQIENRLLTLPADLPASSLVEATNFLNARIRGKTLDEARAELERALATARAELDELTQKVVAEGLASWSGGEAPDRRLIVRGHAKLLEDLKAMEDLERVRLLFDDLETKRGVIELLGRAEDAEGLRIFIGSESKLFSLSGSSTIVAPYRDSAGRVVGVLGVIGPTRLNYARVIPMVDYTAKVVSRVLGLQSDA